MPLTPKLLDYIDGRLSYFDDGYRHPVPYDQVVDGDEVNCYPSQADTINRYLSGHGLVLVKQPDWKYWYTITKK